MCHAVDSVVPTEGTGRYGSAIITVMLDPWTSMPAAAPAMVRRQDADGHRTAIAGA